MDLAGKKFALTGTSGLIGCAFSRRAKELGGEIVPLVRRREQDRPGAVYWNHVSGELDARRLEGCDAVVHLAGESIAAPRWAKAKMERIEKSRVQGTEFLARRLLELPSPPPVFICASATGYYGNTGDAEIDESAPPGKTFLAGVCRRWEEACEPLRQDGVRVVNIRIGMVLSATGGGLPAMLPAFRLGLGGRLGDGRQWTGWIEASDLAEVIAFCVYHAEICGPVNAVSPHPVTNAEFTRILSQVLCRPSLLPAPAFLLRLLLGRMADELLLASCRARPSRLLEHGFQYRFPELEGALRHLLR